MFRGKRRAGAVPPAEVALSPEDELRHFWESRAPRNGPRIAAYADWQLDRARGQEREPRNAVADWLAHARGEEPRPPSAIGELDDAELRELVDFLREACGEAHPLPLLIQLREAAWELQKELNRRDDLRYALTLEARRAARRAAD